MNFQNVHNILNQVSQDINKIKDKLGAENNSAKNFKESFS